MFEFLRGESKRPAGKPDEIAKKFVDEITAAVDHAWEEGFQRGLKVGARHGSKPPEDEIKRLREGGGL